jgi:hypothetical protein
MLGPGFARWSWFRGSLLGVAALVWAGAAAAEQKPMTADLVDGSKMRIDGLLHDWSGTPIDLNQAVKGSSRARVSAMLGYDETTLYVGLEIKDDKLVRDDAATLMLAFPARDRSYSSYEVKLVPGQPGKTAGSVKVNGASPGGAKIVEAPMEGGLTVEASIPWAAFKAAARVRVGLRAELRYADYGAPGQLRGVVGTPGGASASSWPRLLTEPEQALKSNLLDAKDLKKADFFALGDVAGDSMLEAVAIYGGFLTVVGPHYREGKQFYFGDLSVPDASHITRFELRDADGDGKDDIILQKRDGGEKYREIFEIRRVGSDEVPVPVFQHEVGIVTGDGKITNQVELKPEGRGLAVVISRGEAEGFDEATYREPRQGQIPNALFPWDAVESRTFQFSGSRFEATKETKGKAHKGPKKSGARPAPEGPPSPPPPRAPNPDELKDQVYALYKKEHKVGKGTPRFDFVTDVAGDTALERVLVHGKDIVVFGPGFRGGTSYACITVGVADPKDIVDVTSHDLTGDGKAEVIVRAVLHVKAPKEFGEEPVDRYALYIYRVGDDGIARVFAAETGRSMGGNRILAAVALRPAAHGYTIELLPGRAVGWDKKSYPFPPETGLQGGIEALVLPWTTPKRTYAWSGTAFATE